MTDRTHVFSPKLICIAAIFVSAASIAAMPFRADAVPYVNAQLATPEVITQGEPIVLQYMIGNDDKTNLVSVYLGDHENDFFRLSLMSSSTNAADAPKMKPPYNSHGGSQETPIRTIAPGGEISQDIVVSSYFRNIPPGTYTIRLQTYLASADTDEPLRREAEASDARFMHLVGVGKPEAGWLSNTEKPFLVDYSPENGKTSLAAASLSNTGTPFPLTYAAENHNGSVLRAPNITALVV